MIRSSPGLDTAVDLGARTLVFVGERRGQEKPSSLAVASDGVAAMAERSALGPVQTIPISEAFASREAALQTIKLTCASPIVVFDCEHFEPAILFLIGIRGAVRRGVSICVIASTSHGSGPEFIPYHLQGIAFVKVADQLAGDLAATLMQLIKASIDEMRGDEEYADLPAYHAVRRLGSCGRLEELLVLRPFAFAYEMACWRTGLGPALATHFEFQLPGELRSARLSADSLHMSLRDREYCLADWTLLRPDLFYELGVRSASSDGRTLHLIARSHNETESTPQVHTELGHWPCPASHAAIAIRNAQLAQTAHLARLFEPAPYAPDQSCTATIARAVGAFRSQGPSFASEIRRAVMDIACKGSSVRWPT